MQEITAWLNSERDFTKGAELYKKYGTNSFFKDLLKAGPTPYNTKKLGEELESLAPGAPAIPEVKAQSSKLKAEPGPTAITSTLTETQKAENHRKYLSLCADRDQVVKQIDRNMAALDFSNDERILHETAKQILRLDQRKREIWAEIDYYNAHGQFEPVEVLPDKSREEKMQLIYQSISKARKRLKDPTYQGKARARTKKLIEDKLAELELLKGGDE